MGHDAVAGAVAGEGEGGREGDRDWLWLGAAGAQPNTDMCFTSLSLRLEADDGGVGGDEERCV